MMGNVSINFPEATIGTCNIYKKEVNAEPEPPATIIIAPLRESIFTDAAKISWGCSLWKSCQNEGCSYCRLGMTHDD
jgi:hypothetical protein